MSKLILSISGSPKRDGNSEKMLLEAERGCRDAGFEVHRIDTAFLKISGCMEYFYCMNHSECCIHDELEPLYNLVANADGIILSFPVMNMGVPGGMKCFMDRMEPFYTAKYFRKNPIPDASRRSHRLTLLLSNCGMKKSKPFIGPVLTVDSFCDIIDSPVYASILQSGMDEAGNIDGCPGLADEIYTKASAMCRTIDMIAEGDGRDNGCRAKWIRRDVIR